MANPERFQYTQADPKFRDASLMPILPIQLTYEGRLLQANGLLDSGATVNVMPYTMGIDLGASWQTEATPLRLTGNLSKYDAHPLIVSATVGQYPPINLIFAWTRAENVPLILGQMNFFAAFDVCFFRSELRFEVSFRQ